MDQGTTLDKCFAATAAIDMAGAGNCLTVPIGFLDVLNQCTTRTEVLEVYSVWAQHLASADRCSVTLRDGDQWLLVAAMDGIHQAPQKTNHPVQNSTVGIVFERQQTLFLSNVGDINLPDAQTIKSLGYQSALLTPIMNGPHCFGTLAASYKCQSDDPARQMAMMRALARCLGTQLLVIEQMESLSRMARTDALTGAGNRNRLHDDVDAIWVNWKENDSVFSFLTVDIDHFKNINDTYGHDVGDAILVTLVERLKSNSRKSDCLIRMGGEEFGMLLQGCGLAEARRQAERFRNVIRNAPFEVLGHAISVTASIGVTQVLADDRSFDEVLKRSDMALYEAKESGRDRVIEMGARKFSS